MRLIVAAKLDDTHYVMPLVLGSAPFTPTPVETIRQGVKRGLDRAVAILQGEASSLREALEHVELAAGRAGSRPHQPVSSGEVFIVHGHDSPAKIEVARVIECAGLKAVILHEQPNAGRTVIEKFEAHGGSAGFAIVVLTPDDLGGPCAPPGQKQELRPRARQNVIGEMFWFAGKLGRRSVCALKKGEIEMPSDFAGVGYTEMDDHGAWKAQLLRELEAAGYQVNWSKALA